MMPYQNLEEESDIIENSRPEEDARSTGSEIREGFDNAVNRRIEQCEQSGPDLPLWMIKNSRILKALAQCQVMTGLITVALASLNVKEGVLGWLPLGIFVGLYYMFVGFLGICGSASFRRGLVIAHMVTSLHAVLIGVPLIVLYSTVAVYFDGGECHVTCDTAKYTCALQCEKEPTWALTSSRAGQSIDVGQIIVSLVELGLSIACIVLCCINTCESCSYVDEPVLIQVMRHTLKKKTVPEIFVTANGEITERRY